MQRAISVIMLLIFSCLTENYIDAKGLGRVVVTVDNLDAFVKPVASSDVIYTYGICVILHALSIKRDALGKPEYVLVEGSRGVKVGAKNALREVPDLWVKASGIVMWDQMQKWKGCFPVKTIQFDYGFRTNTIELDAHGNGHISVEGERNRCPVIVKHYNNIIRIDDKHNFTSHLFLFDFAARRLTTSSVEMATISWRNCR